MRLSSKLSLLIWVIGFFSLFTPTLYIEERAVSWIELHESPPLWFYMAASFIVFAHDMEVFNGIDFIRKSNTKLTRVILLTISLLMAFALELSVNVYVSGETFWRNSLIFGQPISDTTFVRIGLGYHLIRIARMILAFAILNAIIERNPRKISVEIQRYYKKLREATQEQG